MAATPETGPVAGSVLESWSAGFSHFAAYRTARAALAALLRDRCVKRVWLPAYICGSLFEGAVASGATVLFYPVSATLAADLDGLIPRLEARDAVLGVDYFGFPQDVFREHPVGPADILWIEDRAQALDAGSPWGDVVLYSPRKLFGVADGGLLFSNQRLPAPAQPADETLWAPEDARGADPDGLDPSRWYPAFKAREARLDAEPGAATSRTLRGLASTVAETQAARRRANWRVLDDLLGDYALWPSRPPGSPPLAFPVRVADAADLQARLAEARIWAPRHWADPPSSAADFPIEHTLSRQLLSLPCDPRYDGDDMARIADAVRRAASPVSMQNAG
jgi:dTDP-4-amino-4,6-dideoxygalactose transaminase